MNDMNGTHEDTAIPMVDPETPISATLQAQEWNTLIGILIEAHAPWRVTNPLINKLMQQAQAGARAAMPKPAVANGADLAA